MAATSTIRRRRPMAWSVAALEDLEGMGIDGRQAQATALGLSLPHLDRVRRALRGDLRDDATRRARPPQAPPQGLVQLGVRVPKSILVRLKRHGARKGVSMALLTAVALHDWLASHNTPGPDPLDKKTRHALGL